MTTNPLSTHEAVRIRVDCAPPELRLTLSGELDLACADLSRSVAGIALDRIDRAVIDLGELDFVDSFGIDQLVALRRFLTDQGVSVSLAHAGPLVRRVIWAAGAELELPAAD